MHKKVKGKPLGKYFLPGLVIKYIAGILLGMLYFGYYREGDTILFHEDAMRLARLIYDYPGQYFSILIYNSQSNEVWETLKLTDQPRAFYMAKVLSFFYILTNGNYWVSGFYFSFFAYSGLWTLADKLSTYFPWTRIAAIIAFLFFPSVVFWSSGISKESISIGLLTWIIALYVPTFARGMNIPKRKVLISFILLFLLWMLKYYYAAALVSILAPTMIIGILKSRSMGLKWNFTRQYLYWLSFIVWFIVIASLLHPNLRLDNIMDVIVSNNRLLVQMSNPEDLIHFVNLDSSFLSFARNIPTAIFAGLFQPLAWEAGGFPKIIAGIENVIILVFAILAFINILRINISNNGILVVAAIAYIVISASFLALSTPNMGTLARYKVGFIPIFVYLILADPVFKRFFR